MTMEMAMENRLEEWKEKLFEAMEEKRIPLHMRRPVERWIIDGVGLGGFLFALFSNDLMGAYSKADASNRAAIPRYVKLMYNNMPTGSYGSTVYVKTWAEKGGLRGLNASANE